MTNTSLIYYVIPVAKIFSCKYIYIPFKQNCQENGHSLILASTFGDFYDVVDGYPHFAEPYQIHMFLARSQLGVE